MLKTFVSAETKRGDINRSPVIKATLKLILYINEIRYFFYSNILFYKNKNPKEGFPLRVFVKESWSITLLNQALQPFR